MVQQLKDKHCHFFRQTLASTNSMVCLGVIFGISSLTANVLQAGEAQDAPASHSCDDVNTADMTA